MNNNILKTFIVKHFNGNKTRIISCLLDRASFNQNILLNETKAFCYIKDDFSKKLVESEKEYDDFIEFCKNKDYIYLKCCLESGCVKGDVLFLTLATILSILNMILIYYKLVISSWIAFIPVVLGCVGFYGVFFPFQIKLFSRS